MHTSYGARSLTDVRADINRWQSLYGITSIFLDEAAARVSSRGSDRKLITYYRQLFTYIRGRGGTVTLNPGVVPDQEYLVARAHALGAGHISVTDDILPNPYDSLPSYYEAERQQLRGLS